MCANMSKFGLLVFGPVVYMQVWHKHIYIILAQREGLHKTSSRLAGCNCTDLHVQSTEQGRVHVDLGGVVGRVAKGGNDEGPVRAPCLLQGSFQHEHAVVVCVSFS